MLWESQNGTKAGSCKFETLVAIKYCFARTLRTVNPPLPYTENKKDQTQAEWKRETWLKCITLYLSGWYLRARPRYALRISLCRTKHKRTHTLVNTQFRVAVVCKLHRDIKRCRQSTKDVPELPLWRHPGLDKAYEITERTNMRPECHSSSCCRSTHNTLTIVAIFRAAVNAVKLTPRFSNQTTPYCENER